MKLEATCRCELFAGFFGIDASGNQPECGNTIEIDVELDDLIKVDDDSFCLPYSIECESCGFTHDSEYLLFELV